MKQGQGALEFLMTYGWVFLIILSLIGVMAYLEVLPFSKDNNQTQQDNATLNIKFMNSSQQRVIIFNNTIEIFGCAWMEATNCTEERCDRYLFKCPERFFTND